MRKRSITIIALILLVAGLGVLAYSDAFVHWRMESGSYWRRGDRETVQLTVNSTHNHANISIEEVMLNITHFNVSQANASILIRNENGTIIYNQTEVSGTEITGFASHAEVPPSNASAQEFVVTVLWEGTNTTVSFEYWTYGLLAWDGVPYAVISPGFFMIVGIGLFLIGSSSVLFLFNSWQYGQTKSEKLQGIDFLVVLVGYLLPVLSKMWFASNKIGYMIFSTFWYYIHCLIVGGISYVGPTIQPRSDYSAIAALVCNGMLAIAFWLRSRKRLPPRIFQAVFYISIMPLVGAAIFPFVARFIPLQADFLYIPLPLLQAGIWLLTRNEK